MKRQRFHRRLPALFLLMALSGLGWVAPPQAEAVDLYVGNDVGEIWRIDSDTGNKIRIATGLALAEDMVMDRKGILYIGGLFTGVKRIDAKTGVRLSDVGTNICGPEGGSLDSQGHVYFNTRQGPCAHSGVWKIENGAAQTAIQIVPPIPTPPFVPTVAWGEGSVILTQGPYAGCLLFIESRYSRVYRSCPPNFGAAALVLSTYPVAGVLIGLAVDSGGDFYLSMQSGSILRYAADGTFKEVYVSGLRSAMFIELDEADNLYVVDRLAETVFKINRQKVITPLGGLSRPVGIAIPSGRKMTDVRLLDTVSTSDIDLDQSSFSKQPASVTPDPVNNQTVIEWRYDSFDIGQIEDLSFDLVLKNPLPGEDRIVHHKLELLYSDINGDPVRTELGPRTVHVQSSSMAAAVTTDKTQYTANENTLIDLSVTNLSDHPRTITAELLVEDAQGNLVQPVVTLTNVTFAAGETKSFPDQVYNTGTTPAGDYHARALLSDASGRLGGAAAAFAIQPVIEAAGRIVTDKIEYGAHQAVALTSSVASLSPNQILTGLSAAVSVTGPGGETIFSEMKTLADLLPQARFEFKSFTNTGAHPPGPYTASLTVRTADGQTLSVSAASFSLLSSASTGAGLAGSLTIFPSPVFQGETETLGYHIQNLGNADLGSVPLTILIADPDTQTVLQTLSAAADLPMGGSAAGSLAAHTLQLPPMIYLAILQVSVGGEMLTLASAPFEVRKGLEIGKAIPDFARVLVWTNDGCDDAGQPVGNHGFSDCIRRDLVRAALDGIGADYTLVSDNSAFETELRNNFHTDYLILGDSSPLTDHAARELRERVHAGGGLVSSPWIGNGLENQLYGVSLNGILKQRDNTVEFPESEVYPAMTFPTAGKAVKLQTYDLGEVLGWMTDRDWITYPAVLRHPLGRGRDLFLAFDLGLSATDLNYTDFARVLQDSIRYVHRPQETQAFDPESLVPVELTLKSLGPAYDLKISESYPEAVRLYDPETGAWITENPWTREIHLDAGESRTLRFFARLPEAAGVYNLSSEVDMLLNGLWEGYESHAVELRVDRDRAALTAEVLSRLAALVPDSIQEAAAIEKAARLVREAEARGRTTASDLDQSLSDLLRAVEAVRDITSPDTFEIRLLLDRLIAVDGGVWYFLPP